MNSAPLVDSHCHLQSINLEPFEHHLQHVLTQAHEAGVEHMLSVCIELEDLPALHEIAERYPHISTSVGIHPNQDVLKEPMAEELMRLAHHPSCIAIGETGLDHYRTETDDLREKQSLRFREHIRAARATAKPLIIHTRNAAQDTLRVMKEEKASDVGGVMHCFSEDWDVAQQALDLNFYISFSGIVTFKNATQLQEVARKVPLDRMLIETDSPYLAPVPFRGHQNHPALVKYVALMLSDLRQIPYEEIAQTTTDNFYRCFGVSRT